MSDLTYTVKEILDLQFKSQAKEFEEIKTMLAKQDANVERQFARLDNEIDSLRKEIENLKQDNAKAKVVWSVGATIGASLIAVVTNRILWEQ